jgi:NhaP-type Na+/H+ or K+/H+ antiporter
MPPPQALAPLPRRRRGLLRSRSASSSSNNNGSTRAAALFLAAAAVFTASLLPSGAGVNAQVKLGIVLKGFKGKRERRTRDAETQRRYFFSLVLE